MDFPYITLKQFALKLACEGKIDELQQLLTIFPKAEWLREFVAVQEELRTNEVDVQSLGNESKEQV
jgi:hypothetical protein